MNKITRILAAALLLGIGLSNVQAAYQAGIAVPPATYFQYTTAAGGIVNTTAISVLAAAGASKRIYVTFFKCQNSHPTTGTEYELQDGNGGARVYGGYAAPVGGGESSGDGLGVIARTSANTALYIKELTTTATTGLICQVAGFTDS